MLSKPFDRLSQSLTFSVLANLHQGLLACSVVNAGHILFDDWTLIQVFSYEVSGGTNELDTPRVRLCIGVSALETRQERVMNVDYLSFKFLAKLWR